MTLATELAKLLIDESSLKTEAQIPFYPPTEIITFLPALCHSLIKPEIDTLVS